MNPLGQFLSQLVLLPSVWMPFLLVTAAVAVAIWRVSHWRYGAIIEDLEQRVKLKDDMMNHLERNRELAHRPSSQAGIPYTTDPFVSDDDQRTFVDDGVTLQYLSGLYANRTGLQADKLAAPYIGKWIEVSGRIEIATPFLEEASTLSLELDQARDGFRYAWMMFLTDRGRLEVLAPDTKITAVGRIKSIQESQIELLECELLAIG